MSEEQFQSFIKILDEDRFMQERLANAVDLDSAVAIATEAGFAVSKAEMLSHQAQQPRGTQELSDEDLGGVAGGTASVFVPVIKSNPPPLALPGNVVTGGG